MKLVNLGNTNWSVSNIALGTWRMNKLTVDQAVKTIETAIDQGINFFDSSDVYGRSESEKIFGQAIKQVSKSRDELFIQTKGGIISHQRYDFSKQHLIQAVDNSLMRLDVDYLDSYLLHRPDPLMEPDEVAEAFDDLQKAGKVRHFGVSNFNPQQVSLLQNSLNQKILVNQLQFSLMHTGMIDHGIHTNMTDNRSVNHDGELIEYSRRKNITIQAWSPFQYSNYAGVFIDDPKAENLNQELQKLADKYQVSKNAIAVAWILRHPANFQVLIGTMNPEHIIDSIAGSDIQLSRQEWYDLYLSAGNDLP
ncbi:aldo/keto reductase [Companilactobacillus furfuricola]|uniref:aldo/keto reductase n=1 Tax=Companilactobacillus furfuricola TaxID=1462575 RepID=UPI000F79F310|nr:aldo/keto reductase [Companilactobacillus furfuricola]